VCDRWRGSELRQILEQQEFPRCALVTLEIGYMDGGEDMRLFWSAYLSGNVQSKRCLLLRSAMSGARVTTDPAGNARLSKDGQGRRTRCRDDAVTERPRRAAQAEARPVFQYAIV